MMPRIRTALLVFVVALSSIALANDASFEPILSRLPEGANLLVMLNADQIFESDLAVREGWKQRYAENFAESPLRLPPEAAQFVMAAELDLGSLSPGWEVAVMRMNTDLPISMVQRMVKGQADRFGELDAVVTPNGAYVLRLDESIFGVMRARDRQGVARWVRQQAIQSGPPLTPYLQTAAVYPDRAGTEIIMAIDLTGALGRDQVRNALEASKVVKENGLDIDLTANALAGLKGLTLGVKIGEKATGSLKVEFMSSIAPFEKAAQPLLLEVLEQAGVSINEFYDWEVETRGEAFRISGELTESGLLRVFSFLEIDSSAVDAGGDAVADDSLPGKYQVDPEITKEYYEGVEKHLNDLSREHGAKSYYTIATWFEKYAKRIDRLPILGVDPELVDFSGHVVGQLLDCAEAIRGVGIRSGAKSATVSGSGGSSYSGGGYGYGSNYGYGYGYDNSLFVGSEYANMVDGVRSAESQRIAIRKQERAKGSATVREIMRQLKEETSSIRRGLTQRYQIEF